MSNRLSSRQVAILEQLVEAPAPNKMALVRGHYTGRGHAGSYASIDRLIKRGLVATSPGATKRDVAVTITERGLALLA